MVNLMPKRIPRATKYEKEWMGWAGLFPTDEESNEGKPSFFNENCGGQRSGMLGEGRVATWEGREGWTGQGRAFLSAQKGPSRWVNFVVCDWVGVDGATRGVQGG